MKYIIRILFCRTFPIPRIISGFFSLFIIRHSSQKTKVPHLLSWTTLSSQTRLPRPRRLRSNPIKTNRRISLPRVRVFSRFSSSFKTRSSFPHSILFIWFFQLGFAYILLSLSLFERAREQVKRTVSYPHHHRL